MAAKKVCTSIQFPHQKKYKPLSYLAFFMIFISCTYKEQPLGKQFDKLNLYRTSAQVEMPPFIFQDSFLIVDNSTYVNYNIQILNSSARITSIMSSKENCSGQIDYEKTIEGMKELIINSADSSKQLIDSVKIINNIKVAYIKYFVIRNKKKSYLSRIFFDKKDFATYMFFYEKYDELNPNANILSDHVFSKIQFTL